MLNKINTLLASAAITNIKEFKTTLYTRATPGLGTTFTLPAGITEGSFGLLLVSAVKGLTTDTPIVLGTPTGFTLIAKFQGNIGNGRGSSQGLFYKYMTAADSSTTISTIFADSLADESESVFIEVIQNATTRGFDALTSITGASSSVVATLTDVPSTISAQSPFFILTCATDGGGGGAAAGTLTGGMQLYDTSQNVLNNTVRVVSTLWKYDNIMIKDLPSTEDAIYSASGTGYVSSGVYVIWLR